MFVAILKFTLFLSFTNHSRVAPSVCMCVTCGTCSRFRLLCLSFSLCAHTFFAYVEFSFIVFLYLLPQQSLPVSMCRDNHCNRNGWCQSVLVVLGTARSVASFYHCSVTVPSSLLLILATPSRHIHQLASFHTP